MHKISALYLLGGGQLGRMLLQSAIDFDVEVAVLDPDANAPCSKIAHHFQIGSLQGEATVTGFAKEAQRLTIEIEKVNVAALKQLQAKGVKVFPQPEIVEMIQDKRLQKKFFLEHKIPTSEFVLINEEKQLEKHTDFFPAFQKMAKDGYDGRGVQLLSNTEDLSKAFDGPSLLEKAVDIEKELSVIIARNEQGETKSYPLSELVYHPEQNMVDYLFFPAQIPDEVSKKATALAEQIVEKTGFVGLLAVELFLDKQGNLLVNEMAPRPHNSGHHTIEAFHVSQYEQHLRAVMGWPLGSTNPKVPFAAMLNLLGSKGANGIPNYKGMEEMLSLEGVHFHLYGKQKVKPFRKMGHVTIVGNTKEAVLEKLEKVKASCSVEGN